MKDNHRVALPYKTEYNTTHNQQNGKRIRMGRMGRESEWEDIRILPECKPMGCLLQCPSPCVSMSLQTPYRCIYIPQPPLSGSGKGHNDSPQRQVDRTVARIVVIFLQRVCFRASCSTASCMHVFLTVPVCEKLFCIYVECVGLIYVGFLLALFSRVPECWMLARSCFIFIRMLPFSCIEQWTVVVIVCFLCLILLSLSSLSSVSLQW